MKYLDSLAYDAALEQLAPDGAALAVPADGRAGPYPPLLQRSLLASRLAPTLLNEALGAPPELPAV